MAEDKEQDESQKTEDPTAHRLEEARKKGQVAFSKEVMHWFMISGAAILMVMVLPYTMRTIAQSLRYFIELPHTFRLDATSLQSLLSDVTGNIYLALGLPFGILGIAALFAGLSQTKLTVSFKRIQPKLEKISLQKGLKRLFSKNTVMELLKSILKLTILTAAVGLALKSELISLPQWVQLPIEAFLPKLEKLMLIMFIAILSILSVIAAVDFVYQRYEYIKSLRMSRYDVKQEMKQLEGDPAIKSKLKQIRSERARKRMMAEVPKATAVITNPTHYAVALKYEMEEMDAPVVVAKGADLVALKIREVAEENNVPLFENPPLARALFDTADLDEEIPPEHYQATAEIIRVVMQLKKKYF